MANGAGGAPTKLTPELHAKIVAYVRHGTYIEVAAEACGISKTAFYSWMRQGKDATEGIHFEFYNAIKQAHAEAEVADITRIAKAASEGAWQAAAWRLERKFPQRWARRDRYQLEHSGKNGAPLPTPEAETRVVNVQIVMPQNGYEAPDGDGDGD